jgi:RNA polymerase sigma factor (sigma-70 family)
MAATPMSRIVADLRSVALARAGAELGDAQLLETFLHCQEDAAFEALVRRHGPMVLGVCRRVLRDRHDAEDAFQATFLVLIRKAASLSKRELLANWLYGVAHRTALHACKLAARRRAKERQANMAQRPAGDEAIQDLLPLLDQELSRLPDKYRVPIILCDLEGKTRKEAARQLELPEGTLSTRLSRGRAMLAKRMARHGAALSVCAAAGISANVASAAVPGALVTSTVKAGSVLAAGKKLTAGVVSLSVVALTERVVKTMLMTRLKIAATVCLLACFLGLGFGAANIGEQDSDAKPAPLPAADVIRTDSKDFPEPKLRATLRRQGAVVWSLAYSPDGKTLASGGEDLILLWDPATGKVKDVLSGHKGLVMGLAYSPDGAWLASGAGDKTIRIWNVEKGKVWDTITVKQGIRHLTYSPDGKTLAFAFTSVEPTITLWDVSSGAERATLAIAASAPMTIRLTPVSCSLAFSPNGKTLASGNSDGTVMVWQMSADKERATLKGHADIVSSVAYSPDGTTLASASEDGTIKLWDAATATERTTLKGHVKAVLRVAFHPDGKTLASAGVDKTIRIWDVATGKELATLRGHTEAVTHVVYSPDGKTLASGSEDKTIKLWQMSTDEQARQPGRVGFPAAEKGQASTKYIEAAGQIVKKPKSGGWELEIKIYEKDLPKLLSAFEAAGNKTDLDVDFLLTSQPTRTYKGKLAKERVQLQDFIAPAWVRIDGPDIPKEYRLTEGAREGREVLARIRIGRQTDNPKAKTPPARSLKGESKTEKRTDILELQSVDLTKRTIKAVEGKWPFMPPPHGDQPRPGLLPSFWTNWDLVVLPTTKIIIDGKDASLDALQTARPNWIKVDWEFETTVETKDGSTQITMHDPGRAVRIEATGDQLNELIYAVHDKSVTFRRNPKDLSLRSTYEFAKDIEVVIDGKKAKAADLKPQMPVSLRLSAIKKTLVVAITAAGPKVDGILKSANAEKSTISVTIPTAHMTTVDTRVARDAKVTIDGKAFQLADLKAGMRVTLQMSAEPEQSLILGITAEKGQEAVP